MQKKLEIATYGQRVFLQVISDQRFHTYELNSLRDFIKSLTSKQLSCRGLKELSWVITLPSPERALEMADFLQNVTDYMVLPAGTINPTLGTFNRVLIKQPKESKRTLVYCVPCPHQNLKLDLRKLPQVNHVQLQWPFVSVDFKSPPFEEIRSGPFCKKQVPATEVAKVLGLSDNKSRLVLPW